MNTKLGLANTVLFCAMSVAGQGGYPERPNNIALGDPSLVGTLQSGRHSRTTKTYFGPARSIEFGGGHHIRPQCLTLYPHTLTRAGLSPLVSLLLPVTSGLTLMAKFKV